MPSGSKSAATRPRTPNRPDDRSFVRAVADSLVAVLIAPVCAVCSTSLERPSRGAVCPRCWDAIVPFTPPLCCRCGDPLLTWRAATPDAAACARCRSQEPVIASARAVGSYEGSLRAIIHALKYDKRQSLARPLGQLMARSAEDLLRGIDLVVPVPLHRARRRERGFNQAEELARHLGLPWRRVLRRRRVTRSQADLPADQRRRNVKDAFVRRRGQEIDGLTLLLVDDVSTTGATLEACAQVLRQGGALEVRALTAARVASRPP